MAAAYRAAGRVEDHDARHRREKVTRCRELLGPTTSPTTPIDATSPTDYRDRVQTLTGISLRVCPACHRGEMIIVERFLPARCAVLVNPDTSQ